MSSLTLKCVLFLQGGHCRAAAMSATSATSVRRLAFAAGVFRAFLRVDLVCFRCVCMYVCMSMCVYVCMCVCVCVCVYVYVYVCMSRCVYMYVYVQVCICVCVCVCIYKCMHICIYIHELYVIYAQKWNVPRYRALLRMHRIL